MTQRERESDSGWKYQMSVTPQSDFETHHDVALVSAMNIVKMAQDKIDRMGSSAPRVAWSAFPRVRLVESIGLLDIPDTIDGNAGGYAVWKDTNERVLAHFPFLHEITLRDEMIPHFAPAPHPDCYYWSMLIRPMDNTRFEQDLSMLSSSITYDRRTHRITVRCHFEGANIVTLYLASRLAHGSMSIGDATASYGPLIVSLSSERSQLASHANLSLVDVLEMPYHRALLDYLRFYNSTDRQIVAKEKVRHHKKRPTQPPAAPPPSSQRVW